MPDILAILGRGIYQVQDRGWHLYWKTTDFLEMYDLLGRHPAVKEDVVDDDSRCLVGGGNANVIAGVELFKRYGANVIVFAYGTRSSYLLENNGPAEGEVMLKEFCRRIANDSCKSKVASDVELRRGLPDDQLPPGSVSNTFQELRNILNLALEKNLRTVMIVALKVHALRVKVFLEWLLAHEYQNNQLDLECLVVVAEDVLIFRSLKYLKVIEKVKKSQATARTTAREQAGIKRFQEERYTISEAYHFPT